MTDLFKLFVIFLIPIHCFAYNEKVKATFCTGDSKLAKKFKNYEQYTFQRSTEFDFNGGLWVVIDKKGEITTLDNETFKKNFAKHIEGSENEYIMPIENYNKKGPQKLKDIRVPVKTRAYNFSHHFVVTEDGRVFKSKEYEPLREQKVISKEYSQNYHDSNNVEYEVYPTDGRKIPGYKENETFMGKYAFAVGLSMIARLKDGRYMVLHEQDRTHVLKGNEIPVKGWDEYVSRELKMDPEVVTIDKYFKNGWAITHAGKLVDLKNYRSTKPNGLQLQYQEAKRRDEEEHERRKHEDPLVGLRRKIREEESNFRHMQREQSKVFDIGYDVFLPSGMYNGHTLLGNEKGVVTGINDGMVSIEVQYPNGKTKTVHMSDCRLAFTQVFMKEQIKKYNGRK